jgi:SAM-dependent methyltransferase
MRIGLIPENILEWIALKLNIVPVPLADTMISFILARTIMAATKLEFFEVLARKPLTSKEVAEKCKTEPIATLKLLNALVGIGYLKIKNQKYIMKPFVKKWILKENEPSVHDKMLSNYLDWQLVENIEDYIRSGEAIDFHENAYMTDEQWSLYQRGMRSIAGISAAEVVNKIPVPNDARDLLDIGGSHGFYSVCLCRRHKNLTATILDLPEAILEAKPILEKEGMGKRVRHLEGNALEYDLGVNNWDVIFLSNLVHHFDEDMNKKLVNRIFKSLRPKGIFTILEPIRPVSPKAIKKARLGALLDLFFAVTSKSGTWTIKEINEWQSIAGFTLLKPAWIKSMPGYAQLSAVKMAGSPHIH